MKLFRYPRDEKDVRRVLDATELASLLVPFVTEDDIRMVCAQAAEYGMHSVLAVPDIIVKTRKYLEGTGVVPVCMASSNEVVDNDHGSSMVMIRELIRYGVLDVDMGMPVGMMLNGEFDLVAAQLSERAGLLHDSGGRFGVVLEIDQLPEPLMLKLCEASVKAGADFLRISSGMELMGAMNIGRATVHNTALLYHHFGKDIKIKAGGGWDLGWLEDANEYLEAGASYVDGGPNMVQQLVDMGYRRSCR